MILAAGKTPFTGIQSSQGSAFVFSKSVSKDVYKRQDPDVQNGWIAKNKTKDGLSVSFFKKLTCHIRYSKKNNVFYIAILKEYEDYFIGANLPRMADVAL